MSIGKGVLEMLHNRNRYLFFSLIVTVIVYIFLLIFLYPEWTKSWILLLSGAVLVTIQVVAFVGNLRKIMEDPNKPSSAQLVNNSIASQDNNVMGKGEIVGRDKLVINVNPNNNEILSPTSSFLHQIPSPPRDFTGREEELTELRNALTNRGINISGLRGMGGVGKTALALKLSEELKDRYPDAQIFLDLRGTEKKPLIPSEAMAHIIRSFCPEVRIPDTEAGIKGMYFSLLEKRKVLLLMDNANEADQVLPLIPPISCLLLVTSRKHFVLPGMFPKDIDCLSEAEACELLRKIAININNQAKEIAQLCGYLPLALRLAGSALSEHTDLTATDYIQHLKNEKTLLAPVDASLALSYKLLTAEQKSRWRKLSVFPASFDQEATAAVWAMQPDKAHTDIAHNILSEFVKYSIVEFDRKEGRYSLHDLMRKYADSQLSEGERKELGFNHSRYFLFILEKTDKLYIQGGESFIKGLALFDLEWLNIDAGQIWAAENSKNDDQAAQLCDSYPTAGAYCLELRLHPRTRIRWLESALKAARRIKRKNEGGVHLGNLGIAYYDLGEARHALEYYDQYLEIARKIGDKLGEAQALSGLGITYWSLGELEKAVELFQLALKLYPETDDRHGESRTLGNLGNAYSDLGETTLAMELHEKDLEMSRKLGDSHGEARALRNLGTANYYMSNTQKAIQNFEQCLGIARKIGDRHGEGNILFNLGLVYYSLEEMDRATEFYNLAFTIYHEIGDRRGESRALNGLGIY